MHLEGLGKLKNPMIKIFPACSLVPQPTTPPHAPPNGKVTLKIMNYNGFGRNRSSFESNYFFNIYLEGTVTFMIKLSIVGVQDKI
jgi:hypothetical protein